MTNPAKTTAVDDARKVPHEPECRTSSGYDCTCTIARKSWREAEAKVSALEAKVEAQRVHEYAIKQQSDIYYDAHMAGVERIKLLEAQLRQEREAHAATKLERDGFSSAWDKMADNLRAIAAERKQWQAQVAQLQTTVGQQWISVEDRMPELDADNCCMDEEDYNRYSSVMLVFDEDEARILCAFYDGPMGVWLNAETEAHQKGVTHWRTLPSTPDAALATCPTPAKEGE